MIVHTPIGRSPVGMSKKPRFLVSANTRRSEERADPDLAVGRLAAEIQSAPRGSDQQSAAALPEGRAAFGHLGLPVLDGGALPLLAQAPVRSRPQGGWLEGRPALPASLVRKRVPGSAARHATPRRDPRALRHGGDAPLRPRPPWPPGEGKERRRLRARRLNHRRSGGKIFPLTARLVAARQLYSPALCSGSRYAARP